MMKPVLAVLIMTLLAGCASEQIPDKSYSPSILDPAYEAVTGTVVCLDEAHNNFHTLENRFWAFGELLRRDGYVVEPSKDKFSAAALEHCSILVISNAQLEIYSHVFPVWARIWTLWIAFSAAVAVALGYGHWQSEFQETQS